MPDDARDERPTVLVVEDEALIAALVSDILAEAGYRLDAQAGREAAAAAAA